MNGYAVLVLALLLGLKLTALDAAEVDSASTDPDDRMQIILVRGVQPGPALWKVVSGKHAMWLLGEISPYPSKLKWRSKQFERLLGDSQELLIDLSGYWLVDAEQEATLTQAGRLPEGTMLKDVISPGLVERVDATRTKFGNPSLEQLRAFSWIPSASASGPPRWANGARSRSPTSRRPRSRSSNG
jgi:hypothetical protein